MKHIQSASALMPLGAVIVACPLPLHAVDPIEVTWSDLCSRGRLPIVSTVSGDVVYGDCASINVDVIAIGAKAEAGWCESW
jgi:hypothetical protein